MPENAATPGPGPWPAPTEGGDDLEAALRRAAQARPEAAEIAADDQGASAAAEDDGTDPPG